MKRPVLGSLCAILVLAQLVIGTPARGQPAQSLPPTPDGYACADADGNGQLSPNDFSRFQTAYAARSTYDANFPAGHPDHLIASVNQTGMVTLNWANPGQPWTDGYVTRGGTQIGTFTVNTQTFTDSPGAGTHVYSVTVRNVVQAGAYAGVWAPRGTAPTFTITVAGPPAATGACCSPSGTCTVVTAAACTAGGGVYRGDNVTCAAANCQPAPPSTGWTNLTPPAGAQVFYVAANGNDSNAGTQAAPFRTIGRGYGALRAGQPDQVLLRSGDTFSETIDLTKGSGSATTYMVIGSYGAGPRPRIRSNATPLNGGARNVTGLAIVGLDIAPAGVPDEYATSIWLADGWTNVLVEDCFLSGYQVNLVSHETGTGHITGLKLRRNIIVDSTSHHPGHSGGIFLGSQHNLLIEENVFDRNGRQGEQTIFRHNVYIHDFGSQNVTFRGNTTARACATGVQQRPGGLSENNLLLQNAIGHTWGGNGGLANGGFRHNVAIDARDINTTDRRGIAYSLSGSGTVEYNIAAYQVSGTDAIVAFNFEGFGTGTIRGNYVYDWGSTGNHGWEAASQWDGGSGNVTVTGNKFVMPTVGMLARHESRGVAGFTYSANTYFTSTPAGGVGGYLPFSRSSGEGLDWNGWRALTGESGSTYLTAAPADPHIRVGEYLTSIGVTPGADPIATFMAESRLQSKQNWRENRTANAFNDWARARCGLPPN